MPDLPPLFGEHHVCADCALAYDDLSVPDAVARIGVVADELGALLPTLSEDVLRMRRQPGEWSVLEYACHVRDVLVTFTLRIHRGVVEDRPAVDPMYGELRAVRFGYNEAQAAAVAHEMLAAAQGFATEVAATPSVAWSRTITRRPEEERTVTWLVRQAAHEAIHHRADIARLTVTS